MLCTRCLNPLEEASAFHGMHAKCFSTEFRVAEKTEFRNLSEKATSRKPKGEEYNRFHSSFFHGAFRKYSASLADKNYILKVQQDDYPELPPIEFLSNRIAKILGISVAPFHLIRFQNKDLAFLTKIFLDDYATATLDHIYKFLPERTRFDCGAIVTNILDCTRKLSDVHRFVEICLFDSLIGNHDRHGRNLAYLTKSNGMRTLSPFYDNPSYLGIAEENILGMDLQPKGAVFTKNTKEPTTKDYIDEFYRLGLSRSVDRIRNKFISKTAAIFQSIADFPFLSQKRKRAWVQLIEDRLQEFENG